MRCHGVRAVLAMVVLCAVAVGAVGVVGGDASGIGTADSSTVDAVDTQHSTAHVEFEQSTSSTARFDQSTSSTARFDQSTSTVAISSYSTASISAHQIRLTTTLNRTPERTGEITGTVSAAIPDRVTELTVRLPDEATVVETDGFSQSDTNEYEWDTRTDGPTVTFRVPADQRVDRGGPLAEDGQLLFTETDEWALVRIPSLGANWRFHGDEVTVDRQIEIDGPGVAGDRMAFLGRYDEQTHTAHDQRFRLIVPDSAELAESPERIFGSLSHASDALRVGERDPDVFIIAAPTAGVSWAVSGLQGGTADMWIGDDQRVDTPANVWVHEYIHSRQAFELTDQTQWVTEASATYYAALLTLQEGHISFEEFQRFLADGESEPQSTAVMTDPQSWANDAEYRKGPLVAGEIDRQMRLATDSESSFHAVFRSINSHDGALTAADFEQYVAAASTDEVSTQANKYTSTEATPSMWDRDQHAAAFGQTPARFTFALAADDPLTASGPDGSTTLSRTAPTITAGQTVTVVLTVTNVGGTVGNYELPFAVGDDSSTETGRLGPTETASHEFHHTFDEPGAYTILAGDERIDLTVDPVDSDPDPDSVDIDLDAVPGVSEPPVDVEVPGFGLSTAVAAIVLSVRVLGRHIRRP